MYTSGLYVIVWKGEHYLSAVVFILREILLVFMLYQLFYFMNENSLGVLGNNRTYYQYSKL